MSHVPKCATCDLQLAGKTPQLFDDRRPSSRNCFISRSRHPEGRGAEALGPDHWERLFQAARSVSQGRGGSDDESFANMVHDIISEVPSYRRFLSYRGSEAQILVDALQRLDELDQPFSETMKADMLKARLRLSRRSALLPSTLGLKSVKKAQPIFGSTTVEISRGSYRGRLVVLKRYIAVGHRNKVMLEMLTREALLLSSFKHPRIVPLEGAYVDEDDQGHYLVFPYFEGGNLTQYLQDNSRASRYLLLRDITQAIEHLHRIGLVHGDVKGANVLIDTSGHAYLADMGHSRVIKEASTTWPSLQIESAATLGTVSWRAPELLVADINGTAMCPTVYSDMYAMGCLVYEIFIGKPPLWHITEGRTSPEGKMYKIIRYVVDERGRPLRPEVHEAPFQEHGLTEEVWTTMETCWDRDPAKRPTSCDLATAEFLVDVVDGRGPACF